MVPILFGRIQTRIVLLAVVGSAVTALLVPVLPLAGPLAERYRGAFLVLAAVGVLGIGWEGLYHLLMQFRWEKDWPTLFGLLTVVPEAALLWVLLDRDVVPGLAGRPPLAAYLLHVGLVWLAVWLVANGPMRVPLLRWRFRGGRLI
ncbi:hypothetical protein I0C86_23100 [Plantactinospora sp. S1510]|uniref:Uncharacterized protein n=1 Tax=Plantactinospora alkalitolerans TaxID=2789879 RepID=A0ABS0H056_9ACTN|nr:hypothetical protein [Plantactinospora alkalitolerans]MBF9131830.1 hypothetical protein [Plantactinospora alkalitolerans]